MNSDSSDALLKNSGPTDFMRHFVGRGGELLALHLRLMEKPTRPVFITGLHGVGKSALTFAYYRTFEAEYDRCVRISCSALRGSNIGAVILSHFSSRSKVKSNALGRSVLAVLRQLEKPVLFLVDDIELVSDGDLAQFQLFFEPLLPYCRVIFIGRSARLMSTSVRARPRVILLSPLSRAFAFGVVRSHAAMAGLGPTVAERFIAALSSVQANWEGLNPQFLLQLFDTFQRLGTIDTALLDTLQRYFKPVTNFVISPSPGGVNVLPVGQLESAEIITPDLKIFTAFPFVVVPNYRQVWLRTIQEFEELLNSRLTNEAQIQNFLEQHPQFLKGIDYEKVIPHPVLERDDDGDLIPDFFLKPRGSELVDIMDLKLPNAKLIVGKKNRKKYSGSVSEAIAQVREYRDYFERPDYRERVAKIYGVKAYRPTTIVVIGRQPTELPEEKVRQVFSDLPNHMRLMTYDDMCNRAKAFAEQNSA